MESMWWTFRPVCFDTWCVMLMNDDGYPVYTVEDEEQFETYEFDTIPDLIEFMKTIAPLTKWKEL